MMRTWMCTAVAVVAIAAGCSGGKTPTASTPSASAAPQAMGPRLLTFEQLLERRRNPQLSVQALDSYLVRVGKPRPSTMTSPGPAASGSPMASASPGASPAATTSPMAAMSPAASASPAATASVAPFALLQTTATTAPTTTATTSPTTTTSNPDVNVTNVNSYLSADQVGTLTQTTTNVQVLQNALNESEVITNSLNNSPIAVDAVVAVDLLENSTINLYFF